MEALIVGLVVLMVIVLWSFGQDVDQRDHFEVDSVRRSKGKAEMKNQREGTSGDRWRESAQESGALERPTPWSIQRWPSGSFSRDERTTNDQRVCQGTKTRSPRTEGALPSNASGQDRPSLLGAAGGDDGFGEGRGFVVMPRL